MADLLIRDIHPSDLEKVARIHKNSFSGRALSQLGIGAIHRYYDNT